MPSPETVDKVLAAIRRGDAAAYFFDRLTSPDWIRPLAERGLFRSPAAPIPVEEGRYIQFPIWAPSRYLSRVAHLDPEAVLEVTRDIPDVDNPRVYEDLVDAAVAMPPELAAQLVPRVRAWIRAPYQLLLPLKAGALLSHLARGGQVEAALVLARSLLAVQQEERRLPEDGGIADLGFPPEATPIFDVWDYESILKEHIPDLVDAAGTDALILLRDVLAAAIRLSERVPEQGNEDYSWIWRPAIEDHEKNHDRTAKDFLVSALRDAALRLVERGQVPLRDLAAIFEAGQKYVFDRLFLHLLTRFPEAAPDLLRDRLLDGDLFDLAQVSHEFGLLLNSGFRHLQEEDKRALLAKIETGPDLTRFRERFVEEQGHEPSEDEVEQRQERWRHERLGLMGRDSLPEGWRGRFDELVGRFGAAPDEDFPFFSESWAGDASPKTARELTDMPIPEVIGVLREWITPGDPREATREGLGIALSAAVKERPELFAEEALNFRELDPIYVREYLSGLQEAVKGGARVAWGPVLTLCQWVLEQPRDIPGRVERYSDLDPGWVWTRSGIASLLEVGLTSDASLIPSELRELVWSVIEPLISDPDPEEAADRGGFRDAELSLNSIRGKAMHDVFLYCRWVKLWLDQQGDREHSLEDMPEAERVLRSKLDPAVEGHLAIRAVFGWRYPLLLWLDRSWATEHQDDVFSRQDRGLDALGQSAWNAYLFFARVHLDSLDTLRSQYEVSVETLDSTPRTFPHDDPLIRLSHHLVTFLCTDGLL